MTRIRVRRSPQLAIRDPMKRGEKWVSASRTGDGLGWHQALALSAVFAGELIFFWCETARHYAWIYPRWFDQLQYLREAYDGFEQARSHGFAAGVGRALAHESPQGSLHAFLAMIVFEISGPSRTAALAVNMGMFIALQAATFLAVRKISVSWALAWASLGLLAALQFPWSGDVGSATDFRLDWMAACAYGIALASAVGGDGFRTTRGAVLFGFAVALVLLTRFLTAVYFGLIFVGLFSWLLSEPDRLARIGRLSLSAAVAVGSSGWAFWRSRHLIYDYYWVGHIGTEGAIRGSHMGLLASLGWMAREILFSQVGLPAAVMALAAAGAFAFWRTRDAGARGESKEARLSLGDASKFAVLFAAAPALVLLLHREKTPQTLAIVFPCIVWIIILAWVGLARGSGRQVIRLTCTLVAFAGAVLFVRSQTMDPITPGSAERYREVNAVDDILFFRAEESGLVHPRVAVTGFYDGLNADVLQLAGYERHGRMLRFEGLLPLRIFEETKAVVEERLANSDFVCLVTHTASTWPFDRQMITMLPEMRVWCDGNLEHVGDADIGEFSVSIYERRGLPKPPEREGVNLSAMVAAAASSESPPFAPHKPFFPEGQPVLWSAGSELRYVIKAAYSPVTFRVLELPAGLRLDAESGEIRGRFPGKGEYAATLLATNAAGSSESRIAFHVVDASWIADFNAPAKCRPGAPVQVSYRAFDAEGRLDFIDVTDLTAVKVLVRLVPSGDEKLSWQGSYSLVLNELGLHTVLFRTVRYDPKSNEPYSYVDHRWSVDVEP
jgi:hypothetical protein